MNKKLLALGYFLATLSTNAHAMKVLEDGCVQFCGKIGKRIELETPINCNGLTIASKDLPVSVEAYAGNNEGILRIHGAHYNPNLQGDYFVKNNQLYNAETGELVRQQTSWFASLNKYLPAGCVIIVVGGTLYILYKNGVLKRAYDYIKEHALATALTTAFAGVVGIAAYTLKR